MSLKPVALDDHVGHAKCIRCGTLVDIQPFVGNLILVILTREDHLISFDFHVAFTTASVPDVEYARTIAENLDGILSRIPAPAKIIVFRVEFLLETGA